MRRKICWLSLLCLVSLCSLGNTQSFAKEKVAEKKRPNIVLIVTDDQAPHTLKAYGNTVCQTPNIDQLAASGMTFDQAYHMGAWVSGVCVSSRHMIMAGRTLWHVPAKKNDVRVNPHSLNPKIVPQDLPKYTMAAVFNNAGYDTFRTCKTGNSYNAANELFTTRHDSKKRSSTGSEWHGKQAIDYLNTRKNKAAKKPFLMYLGFSHPHDPRNGTDDLLKKYGAYNAKKPPTKVNPKAPPLPPGYLPAHPFQFRRKGARDEEKVSGVYKSRTEATIRNELGREYACIENIDTQIGKVIAKLKEIGELENTYIIFTSDHGIAVGRHGLQGKQNLYEHSWRVPLIVQGPGIKAGSRTLGNTYLLDLLITMCDLTKTKPPKTIEGISFVPVLRGKTKKSREVLYGAFTGDVKIGAPNGGMRCIRKGDWKLIKYDVMGGTIRKTQLFNLKENPHELLKEHHAPAVIALTKNKPTANQRNLADDPKHAAKRKELEKLLLAEQKRLDDPYRLWDQPKAGQFIPKKTEEK